MLFLRRKTDSFLHIFFLDCSYLLYGSRDISNINYETELYKLNNCPGVLTLDLTNLHVSLVLSRFHAE